MKQTESRFYLSIIAAVLGLLVVGSTIDTKFVDGEIVYSATFFIVVLIIYFQLQNVNLISSEVKFYTFAAYWEESNRLENLLIELHSVYITLIRTVLSAFANVLFLQRAVVLLASVNLSYKVSTRMLNALYLRNKRLPLQQAK